MDDLTTDLETGLLGAGAGLAATAAMSGLMVAARRAGVMGQLPPHRIADEALDRADVHGEARQEGRGALGWLLHFGFGAAVGAAYAVLRRRVRTPGPDTLHGVGFALAVWAVSYLGWVPALRILPTATEDEPGRPATMIAAHLVFGALLGAIVGRSRSSGS